MKNKHKGSDFSDFIPVHPGLIVRNICINNFGLTVTKCAKYLKISRSTLSRLINEKMSITPEMAVRLSIVFGTDSADWVHLQAIYDLYFAEKKRKQLEKICREI